MIVDYYANDVYNQLLKNCCNFINKSCLDIGTRNGANCENLVKVGASSVLGIDIDSSRFHEMWVNKKITLLKQDLLTMDNSKQFDVITCFLWNMPYLQYNNVMVKIKELLNLFELKNLYFVFEMTIKVLRYLGAKSTKSIL